MANIDKEMTEYFVTAMSSPIPEITPFAKRLRVSGFPYCGLRHGYEVLTRAKKEDSDSMKDFYCGVGTAAHEVFQRSVALKGRIYGDWTCRDNKCRAKKAFSNDPKCPKCGKEMLYEEFTVTAFKHVSGHLDGVYKDKAGHFWVIDYKTSSVKAIEGQSKYGSFPYAKNKAQIMSYCAMIEKTLDIKIKGWILIYVARDNPLITHVCSGEVDEKKKRAIWRTIEKYDKQYETVLDLKDENQVLSLVESKPCKTEDQYLKHYKGFEPCPLEGVCFTKHLKTTMAEALEEYHNPTIVTRSKPKGRRKL